MTAGTSRVFRRRPVSTADADNGRTLAGPDRLLTSSDDDGFDAEALFQASYGTLRQGLDAHQELGVLLVAFDDQGTALAQGWLRASLDRSRALIVGRHTACDVALPSSDRNVSLRHLAVVVRAVSHTEARIRVIDLHTVRGFTDETGQVLSAATAEGPMFLGLDGVRLVLLLTGEPGPRSAGQAYRAIPDRVLIEERKGTFSPQHRKQRQVSPNTSAEQTLVRSVLGPVAAASDLCAPDEAPVGQLVLRGQSTLRRAVGPRALDRGILIGRYDRCAVGIEAGRLSRVHFLLVREQGEIIGVDTASSNGSFVGEREVSLTRVADGTAVSLAQALELTWREA